MDDTAWALLRCPRCQTSGTLHAVRAECGECHATYPMRAYLDLTTAVDEAASTEQRLMQSDLVARLYDKTWRPAFVRLLAGRGAQGKIGGVAGEWYVLKQSLGVDERPGPWLDLSCGPGTFTRQIAAAAPGALVVGLDISQAMLEAAGERLAGYPNTALVRGDAHQLPFVSEAFSGVINVGALHVYDEPERVFREVHRVLQRGGLYVGSTFAPARSLVGNAAARLAGIRRFDPRELRAWLGRLGFCDYEELRLGDAFVFRVRRP